MGGLVCSKRMDGRVGEVDEWVGGWEGGCMAGWWGGSRLAILRIMKSWNLENSKSEILNT